MTSVTGICNLALGKLGSSNPIVDITEDTRNGRAMNRIYEAYRDLEVGSHPWTFALTRAQIPALADPPVFGWARAYAKPSGCLRVVGIGERWVLYEQEPSFEMEGLNILCDESSPLDIRYLQRVTNTGLFHPCFVGVLACRLAFEACKEITGSTELRQSLWAERKEILMEARRLNAIEKPPTVTARGSWYYALHGMGG